MNDFPGIKRAALFIFYEYGGQKSREDDVLSKVHQFIHNDYDDDTLSSIESVLASLSDEDLRLVCLANQERETQLEIPHDVDALLNIVFFIVC